MSAEPSLLSYDDLIDALTALREAGEVPWDWIVDETRFVSDYSGYASVADALFANLPYYEVDF